MAAAESEASLRSPDGFQGWNMVADYHPHLRALSGELASSGCGKKPETFGENPRWQGEKMQAPHITGYFGNMRDNNQINNNRGHLNRRLCSTQNNI